MINWQAFWQKKSIANVALLPLSALFYSVTAIRRYLYGKRFFHAEKTSLPVVVVGNINIGGAGKTPLVIALGKLLAQHDMPYAVISKGYGGSYQTATVVKHHDDANVVGDEPLLIKHKCDCPVVVAKSRIEAARLVAEQFPEVKILLTDDGLQHYQLARDMEICVINAAIGLGNGWVLPAGGLREPPSRLQSVDFVVYNGDAGKPYHYILADRGWYHINRDERRYHDDFSDDETRQLALSGIAHPSLFFQQLQTWGIAAQRQAFPDHHAFTQADLPSDKTLLMTEKDWIKIKQFQHDDAWYLVVEAVLCEAFQQAFLAKIRQL